MSDQGDTVFDLDDISNYVSHLSEVNKSNTVVASQDILNDQHAVLVKAGTEIDAKTAEKIVKFKLLRPLEESVNIKNNINGKILYDIINEIVARNPISQQIHSNYKVNDALERLCEFYDRFPILRQKTTVLAQQMKGRYVKSLFSAWLSVVIGLELGLAIDDLKSLFIAALSHDLGMLHIDKAIVDKKQKLTPEEWRQIYAHPIIGEKILANIQGVPTLAARAVKEHHECFDGTGYPSGLREEKLHAFGQIIAMADMTAAVLNKMSKENRGFRDLYPVLQICGFSHLRAVYDAFIRVLKKVELNDACLIDDQTMPAYIDDLVKKDHILSAKLRFAYEPIMAMSTDGIDKKLDAIQTIANNIYKASTSTGIVDLGYLRFLVQVRAENLQHAYREIEDVALMLNELGFQFNRLTRLIEDYIQFASGDCEEVKTGFKTIMDEFESISATPQAEFERLLESA